MERRFGETAAAHWHWGPPPRRWSLADDELHCWASSLEISPDFFQELVSSLSPDERERARRFRVEKARRDFIVTRGLLRKLLGLYLQAPAREILFLYGANGKPVVAPWMSREVQFNVSHSGEIALFAVAARHEVGIDVERITSIPEAAEIAQRFFPREAAERVRNEGHVSQEFFFRSWTQSEAILKCRGEGLSDDVQTALQLSKALVCELEPASGYVGAVAVDSPRPMTLKTWRWEEG